MPGMSLAELVEAIAEAQDTFLLPAMRDRFAIAALPGVIAQRRGYVDATAIAHEAYAIADAMVATMGNGATKPSQEDPSQP